MKFQSSLVKELEFVKEEEEQSGTFFTNLTPGVEEIVEERIVFHASLEMANRTVSSRIVSMT